MADYDTPFSSMIEILPHSSARAISIANEDSEYDEHETVFEYGQKLVIEKVFYDRVAIDGIDNRVVRSVYSG